MEALTSLTTTEGRNPHSENLDTLDTAQLLAMMNAEDARVPAAVQEVLGSVVPVVEAAVAALRRGGRIIYVGAGTSGRLGVLDAVECPPTFGTSPATVVGLLAGGRDAMFRSAEGAEDDADRGASDVSDLEVGSDDVVVGLAASGRTPYVIGAVRKAKACGAVTASVCCNRGAALSKEVDLPIEVDAGPEVVTGSTRLKAGTAQKLVLNMISTATMVGLGKTYGNLMVDVAPSNEKLRRRAHSIVTAATGCDAPTASDALARCDGHAKTAIIMILLDIDAEQARHRLDEASGHVRIALDDKRSAPDRPSNHTWEQQ